MGAWGIGHWLIVLLVVVLLFGTKKLGNIGGDVASAIKNFRKGLHDDDSRPQDQLKADPPPPSSTPVNDIKRDNTPQG